MATALHTNKSVSTLDFSREEREKFVKIARASVELEGFTSPYAYKKLTEQFIRGDFDLPVLIEKALEMAHKIKEGNEID